MIQPGKTIGIIGAGQLGKMLAMSAAHLGYKTVIVSDSEDSPAFEVTAKSMLIDYQDEVALKAFADLVDVVTLEFENIPVSSISCLEKWVSVKPGAKALEICQNRLKEKTFANALDIPTAKFTKVVTNQVESLQTISFPAILKTTTLGYDGKGQYVLKNHQQLADLLPSLQGEYILESFVDFAYEASVIIARKENGESRCFPLTINTHRNGILAVSSVPANVEDAIKQNAYNYTKKLADNLNLVGLLAVEYFISKEGHVLFNEMAPRPHNSGHWTMDGCYTSQFEQHIRAVCNLPLGSADIIAPIQMYNLIGEEINQWPEILRDPKSKLYIYGKKSIKVGRKMGHYNKWD